jgi:hypothetical protein
VALLDSATRGLLGIGWIRSVRFDLTFLAGIPALALAAGVLISADGRWLLPVLLADLGLLARRHAMATADRGADVQARILRHRFLAVELPLLALAGLAGLALTVAAWLPATLYFYWQWFHGARASRSIVETYRWRADPGADLGDRALLTAAFYMVPAWGMLYRCAQGPHGFLGLEMRLLPVAWPMVDVVGIAACGAVALWLIERAIAWSEGRLPLAHTLYAVSHLIVFAVAYRLIDDAVVGWLVAHIWRNGQYICLASRRTRGHGDTASNELASRRPVPWNQLGLWAGIAMAGVAMAFLVEDVLAVLLPCVAILFLAADVRESIVAMAQRRAIRRWRAQPLERAKVRADGPSLGRGGNVLKIT